MICGTLFVAIVAPFMRRKKAHSKTDPYRLETVTRACKLLRAFSSETESLRLSELVRRTGIEKTIALRLVRTLESAGFLRRMDKHHYVSNISVLERRRYKIGYAAQADGSAFSQAVTQGLVRAAEKQHIDLLVLDNRYSPKAAIKNAEHLIQERVDLALEFQTFEKVAPVISSMFHRAGIPLIAIEIPHPGAVFFGADNYRVGLSAGRVLARWAKRRWENGVEEVLLMSLGVAGNLPQLRLSGVHDGIREILPTVRQEQFVFMDCRGEFGASLELVRKHLRLVPKRRTLISGINDPSVLGALRAFEEAGRSSSCFALGLGAIAEARAELQRPSSALIGSIAFFPESYGEELVGLSLDILRKRFVPPAVYARHTLITADNLRRYYPLTDSAV
jgi:ribose transport system substrate-binding protein